MTSTPSLRIRILLASMLVLLVATTAVGLWRNANPASADGKDGGGAQPLVMTPGEEVVLGDGTRLRFLGVVEDSRCPMDAMCPWMGEAVVAFEIELAVATQRFHVTFHGEPASTTVGGYVVEVTEVQPYPMASQPTAAEDYRVSVGFRAK